MSVFNDLDFADHSQPVVHIPRKFHSDVTEPNKTLDQCHDTTPPPSTPPKVSSRYTGFCYRFSPEPIPLVRPHDRLEADASDLCGKFWCGNFRERKECANACYSRPTGCCFAMFCLLSILVGSLVATYYYRMIALVVPAVLSALIIAYVVSIYCRGRRGYQATEASNTV